MIVEDHQCKCNCNSRYTMFLLNDVEMDRYNEFRSLHGQSCKDTVSITFTPTGIGINIVAKCNGCNEEQDISDYDTW